MLGKINFLDHPKQLRQHLDRLTEKNEEKSLLPWRLSDAPRYSSGEPMKGVFDTRPSTEYDDDIGRRYHFPNRYLAEA